MNRHIEYWGERSLEIGRYYFFPRLPQYFPVSQNGETCGSHRAQQPQSRPKVVGTLELYHVSPITPNQFWKTSRFFKQKEKKSPDNQHWKWGEWRTYFLSQHFPLLLLQWISTTNNGHPQNTQQLINNLWVSFSYNNFHSSSIID